MKFREVLRDKQAMETLYNECGSMLAIASKLGCGETAVHKWLHRHGITIKPRLMCQKGVRKSQSHKARIAEFAKTRLGEINPNWRGGRTKQDRLIRGRGYVRRTRAVKERDGYKCRECESRQNLHVHHILQVKDHPELINDLNNCITLCRRCHHALHFPKINQANSVNPTVEIPGNAELNAMVA